MNKFESAVSQKVVAIQVVKELEDQNRHSICCMVRAKWADGKSGIREVYVDCEYKYVEALKLITDYLDTSLNEYRHKNNIAKLREVETNPKI